MFISISLLPSFFGKYSPLSKTPSLFTILSILIPTISAKFFVSYWLSLINWRMALLGRGSVKSFLNKGLIIFSSSNLITSCSETPPIIVGIFILYNVLWILSNRSIFKWIFELLNFSNSDINDLLNNVLNVSAVSSLFAKTLFRLFLAFPRLWFFEVFCLAKPNFSFRNSSVSKKAVMNNFLMEISAPRII